jgi:hypothetical protein
MKIGRAYVFRERRALREINTRVARLYRLTTYFYHVSRVYNEAGSIQTLLHAMKCEMVHLRCKAEMLLA